MKKRDLLKYFDDSLLDKLFGFCYARTNDSYEAEELCSDIVCALVKAAQTGGEIESVFFALIRKVCVHVSSNSPNERINAFDLSFGTGCFYESVYYIRAQLLCFIAVLCP